jgi:hypothetical protein
MMGWGVVMVMGVSVCEGMMERKAGEDVRQGRADNFELDGNVRRCTSSEENKTV